MHLLIQSILDGALVGGIYALAGVTFGIFYQIARVFHIAFAGLGTMGTYIAVEVSGSDGSVWGLVGGLLAGMAACGIGSVVVYAIVYRPLARRGADAGSTFVASLGVSTVILALLQLKFGPDSRSFGRDGLTKYHDVLGFDVSILLIVVACVVTVVIGAIGYVLHRTRVGSQLRALISNREQATLVGIRTGVLGSVACGVLGALSVIAFALQGISTSVVLTSGTTLTLNAVLAVIAGGVGSIRGTAAVGLALGVIGGVAGVVVPGQWSTSVVFGCALVMIVIRPRGLVRTAVSA